MKDGFLLIDKPAGPTAHDVVDVVRRGLGVRRVGHIGTLDPFATGLLVLLVGRATRLSQFLVGLRKEYAGTVRLGISTDTHDLTGDTVAENGGWQDLTREQIEDRAAGLLGRQMQVPPRHSAKKVGGQRAYRLARKGEVFELPAREIEVFEFAVKDLALPDFTFRCEVSSGTYVRGLARDLGESLGCGAHLRSLNRTSVGNFEIGRAQDLAGINADTASMGSPAEAVGNLPQYVIEDDELRRMVANGKPIPAPDGDPGCVALVAGRELVAVAERRDGLFRPRVVMEG